MIINRTPFIVPTHIEWLGLLVMIGVFGFFAQVSFLAENEISI